MTLPAPSCLLVWWSSTLRSTRGCTFTWLAGTVSDEADAATAASDRAGLVSMRAGELPYVVGATMAISSVDGTVGKAGDNRGQVFHSPPASTHSKRMRMSGW